MAGIYISYPFCAQKCTFCNFGSGVHSEGTKRTYWDALIAEIRATALPFTPDTLYLGGGTPSLLSQEHLETLLTALPFSFRESTLEAAPGTLSAKRVRGWSDLSFNRVSLGVQSFVTSELRRTGRTHTAATVEHDVDLLRQNGIANFNIDLIAGLPGQTEASWAESLDWIARLAPPHVSVYLFEIDEDSRLGAEVLLNGERYGAPDLPSEDLTAQLYEAAVIRLEELGIRRYEISNFAQPGAESLHNLKYWQLAPYVGFGAGAHSYHGDLRHQNADDVQAYLTQETGPPPERADPSERFWVGLRLTQGISPTLQEWRTHETVIARLVKQDMLERIGARLRLTARGVMLSNEVFQEFLP